MQITVKVADFIGKLEAKKAKLLDRKAALLKKQNDAKGKVAKARNKAVDEAIKFLQEVKAGKVPDPFGNRFLDTGYAVTLKGKKFKSRLIVPVKSVSQLSMGADYQTRNDIESVQKHITAIDDALRVARMSSEETMVLDEDTGYYRLLHDRSTVVGRNIY